jgi:hypothetical protein
MNLSSEIIEAKWFRPDSMPQPIFPFVEEAVAAAVKMNGKPIGREV